VGHALATVDINDRFYARVLARGPTAAEPRLFPPTSPNVVPGQLAILFGLTGPSAATCGSLAGSVEALTVARTLVAAGDVDRMLVVALDRGGPASSALRAAAFPGVDLPDGAVAILLDSGASSMPLGDVAPPLPHEAGLNALTSRLGIAPGSATLLD
jgi:hypothetical protein